MGDGKRRGVKMMSLEKGDLMMKSLYRYPYELCYSHLLL